VRTVRPGTGAPGRSPARRARPGAYADPDRWTAGRSARPVAGSAAPRATPRWQAGGARMAVVWIVRARVPAARWPVPGARGRWAPVPRPGRASPLHRVLRPCSHQAPFAPFIASGPVHRASPATVGPLAHPARPWRGRPSAHRHRGTRGRPASSGAGPGHPHPGFTLRGRSVDRSAPAWPVGARARNDGRIRRRTPRRASRRPCPACGGNGATAHLTVLPSPVAPPYGPPGPRRGPGGSTGWGAPPCAPGHGVRRTAGEPARREGRW